MVEKKNISTVQVKKTTRNTSQIKSITIKFLKETFGRYGLH
jgi:hypothetical protein